jgi:hypothetical protein
MARTSGAQNRANRPRRAPLRECVELADLQETHYFLVDAVAMKLREAATAFPYSMIWLPGREELLYVTPMQTAPLPGGRGDRNVWYSI